MKISPDAGMAAIFASAGRRLPLLPPRPRAAPAPPAAQRRRHGAPPADRALGGGGRPQRARGRGEAQEHAGDALHLLATRSAAICARLRSARAKKPLRSQTNQTSSFRPDSTRPLLSPRPTRTEISRARVSSSVVVGVARRRRSEAGAAGCASSRARAAGCAPPRRVPGPTLGPGRSSGRARAEAVVDKPPALPRLVAAARRRRRRRRTAASGRGRRRACRLAHVAAERRRREGRRRFRRRRRADAVRVREVLLARPAARARRRRRVRPLDARVEGGAPLLDADVERRAACASGSDLPRLTPWSIVQSTAAVVERLAHDAPAAC